MILFSSLTLWNLKHLRQPMHIHRRDFQLVRMLLMHIIVYPIDLVDNALTR